MKNKIILGLIIVSILVFSGCGDSNTTTVSNVDPYYGGTQSLDISFLAEFPPSEVSVSSDDPGSNQDFAIIVNLRNNGEYNIPVGGAKVQINGLSSALFNFEEVKQTNVDALTGKIKGSGLEGYDQQISFNNLKYTKTSDTIQQYNINANVCYIYGTHAQGQLCVKKNPTRPSEQGECEIKGAKTLKSSAGPIQFSGLEEFARGTQEIGFKFNVIHSGAGLFSAPNSDCSRELDFKDKIKLEVSSDEFVVECSGFNKYDTGKNVGEIRLVSGQTRTINCFLRVDPNMEEAFKTPIIKIKSEYDYSKTISSSMVLQPFY